MKLIILNGPPGVGKSTLATRLAEKVPGTEIIEIDVLRRTIPEYREHRKESILAAYNLALAALKEHFSQGRSVIVDKAAFFPETVDRFVETGKLCGAEIFEFFIFADKSTIQARADARGYRPGGLLTRERVGEKWDEADAFCKQRPQATLIDTFHLTMDQVFEEVSRAILSE